MADGLKRAFAAARASRKPAAKAEHGWRPIATAPRDGTDFLAALEYKRRHHQMVGCFAPDGKFHSWPGRHVYEPTHWMPLRPPPAEEPQP